MIDVGKIIDKGVNVRFQPIVSVRRKSLVGFESLVRAVDPSDGSPVPPDALFAAAARQGLVLELDRACRAAALSAFAPLHAKNQSLILFLNFESSIIDTGAVGSGNLIAAARGSGVDPRNVVIEIVESKVNDTGAMRVFIESHRAEGFLIALDDVGEGHSNLNRIPLVRPDIIKIDRSIIGGVSREYYNRKIVEALRVLSRGIGALLLAEGVEDPEDAVASYEAGADLFQGYFFSRPVPPEESMRENPGPIAQVFDRGRARALEEYSSRQTAERLFRDALERLSASLSGQPRDDSFSRISDWLCGIPDCECVYLLDGEGFQIGPTLCSESAAGARARSKLYHPADPGTDHSRKEYFCMVKERGGWCLTEPYISLATGSVCRTAAMCASHRETGLIILCADFRCSA